MVLVALYSGGTYMAYYLKQTKLKGRTYLSICDSYYHPEKKQTAQRLYKSYGSVETLKENGMQDPVAFYKKKVDEMNKRRNKNKEKEKIRKIGKSPMRHLGYFPFKGVLGGLDIKKHMEFLGIMRSFQFNLFDAIQALTYARLVSPCSKYATFHDVLPKLYDEYDLSYDQILNACEFMGSEYEKIVEILTYAVSEKFSVNTDKTYFDCTNFYFEIDKESDFQKKGYSKENRRDPIVGMGLLLDSNRIPIGLKLFAGNLSEKPILRNILNDMKRRNHIKGRTIQVADKGLNCANNILSALKNNDGYIFSKSVKKLPQKEQEWVFLNNGMWMDVLDQDNKVKYRYKSCIDRFAYDYTDENGKKHTIRLKEKRMVTYNPTLARKQRFEIQKQVAKARGLCLSKAKRNEYGDCSKYVTFSSTSKGKKTSDKVAVSINEKAVETALKLAGYNLLVTSETCMKESEIYNTYHNLWQIEESFRIMKSELDARPVFLQKENSIKGHFLICYIAVLLERLLQYNILDGKYSASKLMKFAREFMVMKSENKRYINTTASCEVIERLAEDLSVPITNYYLDKAQINKMLNTKLLPSKRKKPTH